MKNLVFVNSLEQKSNTGVVTAQIMIAEQKGVWSVIWSVVWAEGRIIETWHNSDNWENMLAAFRSRLQEKLRLGFNPVIGLEGVQGFPAQQVHLYYDDWAKFCAGDEVTAFKEGHHQGWDTYKKICVAGEEVTADHGATVSIIKRY